MHQRPATPPAPRRLRVPGDYRRLLDQLPEALCVCREGVVIYANRQAAQLLGWADAGDLAGRSLPDLVHPSSAAALSAALRTLHSQGSGSVEDHIVTRDGRGLDLELSARRIELKDGPADSLILRDVSERRALEDQLAQQAFLDPLTGLANRALFMVRLEHAALRADRHGRNLAVLFLDLDDFKRINDSLGHDCGDLLLIQVARRLRASLRQEDTLARLGGDEFTALLEDLADPADAGKVADRIHRRLQQPFAIGDRRLQVSCSIGITVRPPGGAAPHELLRQADIAMYRAKQRGKARYALFEPAMGVEARRRLALEQELRRALEAGEFRLHYQPLVSLPGGRISGVEAVLHWQHPRRGLLCPGSFMDVAEESGLILPIGRWVLREACRQVQSWQEAYPGDPALVLSVNLSARQLRLPDLVEEVAAALAASGLPAPCLQIEISERAVQADPGGSAQVLQGLKELGVRLALDGFGSGPASLTFLKTLPFDVVKIDGSFTRAAAGEAEVRGVLQHVIGLARAFCREVVCEGVETAEQVRILRELTCDGAQGNAFGQPLPPAEVEPLLEVSRRW